MHHPLASEPKETQLNFSPHAHSWNFSNGVKGRVGLMVPRHLSLDGERPGALLCGQTQLPSDFSFTRLLMKDRPLCSVQMPFWTLGAGRVSM